MANSSGIEALKGTWDYIDGENFENYLKEVGVGWITRKFAVKAKPRLIITEKDGKWTLRTESPFKTLMIEFTPGVEFTEITVEGEELRQTICFENGKWIQTMHHKNGKQSLVIRYVDDQDQQHATVECGPVKATRLFKRVQ